MITVKASTKKGQQLLNTANNVEGYMLCDVYGSWSHEKQMAYLNCSLLFENDIHATNFHICSHNINTFSVAWNTWYKDDSGDVVKVVRMETRYNSYEILLDK